MLGIFGGKSLNRDRVIIADDEPMIRRVFTLIISDKFKNLRLEEACNGLEAVRLFQASYPALILMDLRMPEMDGVAAALAIRKICNDEKYPMPLIIFCTGFAPPAALKELLGDGSYHKLICKPIGSQQLVDVVAAAMAIVTG